MSRIRKARSGRVTDVEVPAGTVTAIATANPYRINLSVQNYGGGSVSVGYSTAMAVGSASLIVANSGGSHVETNYVGPLYATVGSGTVTIQVIETLE